MSLIRTDGLVCVAAGIVIAATASRLDGILGLPAAVLAAVGLGLIAYGAVLLALARRGAPASGVRTAVAVNVLWAVASVVVAATGSLTAVGTAVVLLQAVAVAAVAGLELRTLRQAAA
jgi:hypothetical protein